MLKPSDVAMIQNHIDNCIRDLLKYDNDFGGVRLPKTNSMQEIIAGRMWLISRAHARVGSMLKAVQGEALLEGVTVDKDTSGIPPGTTNHVVYSGSHFMSTCTVKQPSMGFDKDAAKKKMMELKIPAAKITQIMEAGDRENKAAHSFSVIPRPVVGGTNGGK